MPPKAKSARTFPVLKGWMAADDKARCPDTIPWKMVESMRKQIEANHGRTLEDLANYGLSPLELWLAARGQDLPRGRIYERQEAQALDWLIKQVAV